MKEKILLAWSGGKDSALNLEAIKNDGGYEIVSLLTTVTEGYERVSMHGVRKVLLEQQARSAGLPLDIVYITQKATNEQYETRMKAVLEKHKKNDVTSVAFGDLFLEDLKKYREENLAKVGMKALFPLWRTDTTELSRYFVDSGFKAVVTCVDSELLDGSFSGRDYDESFLADLPEGVDPCGENGEFHSFVYDGPVFKRAVEIVKGEIVKRDDRFFFSDLLPKDN